MCPKLRSQVVRSQMVRALLSSFWRREGIKGLKDTGFEHIWEVVEPQMGTLPDCIQAFIGVKGCLRLGAQPTLAGTGTIAAVTSATERWEASTLPEPHGVIE